MIQVVFNDVQFYSWTSFAKNWNQFVQLYPKFSFGVGSKMTVTAYEDGKETNSTTIDSKIRNTADILNAEDNDNNTTFDCEVIADDGLDLTLHLTLYHDDTSLNIALSYSSQWPQFDIDEGGGDFVNTNYNITSFYFSK